MHSRPRRFSSLKYCEYYRSSRLAGGAPPRRMTIRLFIRGPLAVPSDQRHRRVSVFGMTTTTAIKSVRRLAQRCAMLLSAFDARRIAIEPFDCVRVTIPLSALARREGRRPSGASTRGHTLCMGLCRTDPGRRRARRLEAPSFGGGWRECARARGRQSGGEYDDDDRVEPGDAVDVHELARHACRATAATAARRGSPHTLRPMRSRAS